MIRQLMREQLRAHRTYLIWTTLLLALAISFTSYAMFTAAQATAVTTYVTAAHGQDGEFQTVVGIGNAGTAASVISYPTILSEDEVTVFIAAQNEAGADLAASRYVDAVEFATQPDASWTLRDGQISGWLTVALDGNVDWDALLVEGEPPGTGEVALSAAVADGEDLAIGDQVYAVAALGEDGTVDTQLGAFTVSGLLRSSLPDRYAVWQESAIISWDSADSLSAAIVDALGIDPAYDVDTAYLFAQTETPDLAALGEPEMWASIYTGYDDQSQMIFPLLAAGVLTIGLLGMAFAVGRAQAQVRMQWIATARTLGARRSTIAGATALEALAVGTVAGLLGVGGALATLGLEWRTLLSANPSALVPDHLAVPLSSAIPMLGLSLTVAAIISAVPAFWTVRAAPAAALKPATPVTEATVSRAVPLWPLLSLWTVLAIGTLLAVHGIPGEQGWAAELSSTAGFWVVTAVAMLTGAVASVALIVELTRRAVASVASRLSRSTRPWAIAAGSALQARPALASAPAAVFALAATVGAGIATYLALYLWAWSGGEPEYAEFLLRPESLLSFTSVAAAGTDFGETARIAGTVGGLLALVALAAFVSGQAATKDESRAQHALGLDAAAARKASAAQYGLPLALGVLGGTLIGMLGATALFRYDLASYDEDWVQNAHVPLGPAWAFTHLTHALIPVGLVAIVLLAAVAGGALLAALATREASRPSARVSV